MSGGWVLGVSGVLGLSGVVVLGGMVLGSPCGIDCGLGELLSFSRAF